MPFALTNPGMRKAATLSPCGFGSPAEKISRSTRLGFLGAAAWDSAELALERAAARKIVTDTAVMLMIMMSGAVGHCH